MKRITFFIRRLFSLNYRQFFEAISRLHKKLGRSRFGLFFDMVRCGLLYGAGYRDYELCEFYNLTPAQRETYVTRGVNNRIVRLLNDPAYKHCLEDKVEFNRLFAPYIRRGWLDMRSADADEFAAFMAERDVIIAKPLDDSCGRGVEKLNKADFPSVPALYEHIRAAGAGLVEDYICQHPQVSVIYPHSVNTYRIVTVCRNGEAHVVYAFIRIGNGGRFVDNINAGGMAAPIDLDTGVIRYPAFDKNSQYYETHPMTGFRIVGHALPFWQQSLEMCRAAALTVPQVGYVGWDIAVTEVGPQLIEGNPFPGHDILQMPPHVPDKIGMLPRFREFLPEL